MTSGVVEPLLTNPIALAIIISTIISTPSQKPLAARPKSVSACSVAIGASAII